MVLEKQLMGEITSRSSWARLGLRVQTVDDHLFPGYRFEGAPLCTLNSCGTSFRIKPDDSIAQLYLHYGFVPCFDHQLPSLVRSGELTIAREGKNLDYLELHYNQGILLTMDADIWVYKGGILEQGTVKEQHFHHVNLHDYPQGFFLPKGSFFISTSAEAVCIPSRYVGYIKINNCESEEGFFSVHANAPYVGSVQIFKGQITFENMMFFDGVIRSGMVQSSLTLLKLLTPITSGKKSRYNSQTGATLSKL